MTGPSFNRNSWGGNPESLGTNRSAYTLETSHYLFNIKLHVSRLCNTTQRHLHEVLPVDSLET